MSDYLYRISNSALAALAQCQNKSDWYEMASQLEIDSAPELDCEQTLVDLSTSNSPLALLYRGELSSRDGTGDPDFCFIGKERVKEIAAYLFEHTDEEILLSLQLSRDCAWLLEPLRDFCHRAASQDEALLALLTE
jgi:hypothetical protein